MNTHFPQSMSKFRLIVSMFSMQDAMSVARNILKNPKLLPGGGATELTVSATLKQKSSSVEGVEKVLFCYC